MERAKELINYGELPMVEVAQQLGYSSLAHLSRQFRQVTGLTPTEFQRLGRRAMRGGAWMRRFEVLLTPELGHRLCLIIWC